MSDKTAKPKRRPKERGVDKEFEIFRDQMRPPGKFEEGFSWESFIGALFIGMVMVPGAIYMTLLAGESIGPAAQWVTLILFLEVARRANRDIPNAQIFTLFYISGALMATASGSAGNFHGGLQAIYNQFFVQSDAARAAGIAELMPSWVAPNDPAVLESRSFLRIEWLAPIGLMIFTMILGRIDSMIVGYGLFRLTSDIEKLPFPMAPVGAQGILALSEEQKGHEISSESGREGVSKWRMFSIGSVIGLIFGFVYLGIPTITGALLNEPIILIPLPFVDFTRDTAGILPAAAVGLAFDLGFVIVGMVLPYWAMVGSFIGLLVTLIVNPILYRGGVLTSWNPGDNLQETFYKGNIDFYFSFSIGIALAIAIAGIVSVTLKTRRDRARREREQNPLALTSSTIPEGRGDIRALWVFATYLIACALYIGVSMYLLYITDGSIHWPVVWIMLFYAFVFTPFISYMTARMEGIAGQVVTIPFVREACFILSGYSGVAVWFLPIPLHNYGQMTVFYRQCELTGTKFTSIWKSEVLLMPIILGFSLLFAHMIWQMGDIPGPNFPFAQQWWEVTAAQKSLIFSSTLGGFTEFEQAINPGYIGWGVGLGCLAFALMGWFALPVFLIYGVVRGLNQTLPFMVIPQFFGALLGRFYFQRKFGAKKWRQMIPVIFAGFSCGMGLIAVFALGFVFLKGSVISLPF
ncbi:MAG: peptide transporter [Verrucomicrobia bacterium]|nr:peptide transporter [Verrucomicrobiota bacterium]MCH8526637.1 peptide transporter [Kiritimatiellia bacterium]